MAHDLLNDGRLERRGLFQQTEIERMWQRHRTGAANHHQRLWQLVMLELWFRCFVDGGRSQAAAPRPPLAQAV